MKIKRGADWYTKVYFGHWAEFPEDDFDCDHCPFIAFDQMRRQYCFITKRLIYRSKGYIDRHCPAKQIIGKDGKAEIIDG